MQVEILSGWGDNYTYVIVSDEVALVVDPPAADLVEQRLKKLGIDLKHILITHHHGDHTGGCQGLKAETGCDVIGPSGSIIDGPVIDGDELNLNGLKVCALSVPGHTGSDIAYWFPNEKAVFTGDTLFAGGCGRVFGGDYRAMWQSLMRLRDLPDETLVYCGHEYTVENLQFASSLEPDNQDVAERLEAEKDKLRKGDPTVPSSIALEKRTNPFFRVDTQEVASAVDMPGADACDVFAQVRKLKDRF